MICRHRTGSPRRGIRRLVCAPRHLQNAQSQKNVRNIRCLSIRVPSVRCSALLFHDRPDYRDAFLKYVGRFAHGCHPPMSNCVSQKGFLTLRDRRASSRTRKIDPTLVAMWEHVLLDCGLDSDRMCLTLEPQAPDLPEGTPLKTLQRCCAVGSQARNRVAQVSSDSRSYS